MSLGSVMASETTAAACGRVGKLCFDPMDMLPSVGDDSVELEIDGTSSNFEGVDAPRLASLVNSGRCALSDGTRTFGLLGSFGVLVFSVSDEGSTISRQPVIDPNIVMIDDGAAIFSPTDGGSWHLFGVVPGCERVTVVPLLVRIFFDATKVGPGKTWQRGRNLEVTSARTTS
jgi:hypothetical protein